MSPNDYIQVSPSGGAWRVTRQGSRRALKVFRGPFCFDEAMVFARERAKVIWLYGNDGRIAQRIEVA